jgi:alginate O-acetyltransferase complex protein AlgJ
MWNVILQPKPDQANSKHAGTATFDMQKHEYLENIICVIFFSTTLIFFSIATVYFCFANTDSIAEKEKRLLAPFPRMRNVRHDSQTFAAGFEKYYRDRFAFRLPLTTTCNLTAFKIFHTSGTKLVAIGKQDWLYYTKEGTFDSEINKGPFSKEKLEMWSRMFQTRQKILAEHHIPYVLIVVPEKGTIYPEYLPRGWFRHSGITRVEQLQDNLATHTKVDFVNALSILSSNKSQEYLLYHPNDTHWNSYGAFFVAQDILKHLSKYFPSVKTFGQSEYSLEKESFKGNLSTADGLEDWLIDQCPKVEPTAKVYQVTSGTVGAPASETHIAQSSSPPLPSAYVLHDSYIGRLTPFLSNRCRSIQYHSTHVFNTTDILKIKPDVVIEEIAEHHLFDYEPDNVPVTASTTDDTDHFEAAIFGDGLILKDVAAKSTVSGLAVRFHWRANKKIKRNMKIGIHQLDDHGQSMNVYDFYQDTTQSEVLPGTEWIDTVEIPTCSTTPSNLGVLVYNDDSFHASLPVNTKKSDWGGIRAVFSLDELEKTSGSF